MFKNRVSKLSSNDDGGKEMSIDWQNILFNFLEWFGTIYI